MYRDTRVALRIYIHRLYADQCIRVLTAWSAIASLR